MDWVFWYSSVTSTKKNPNKGGLYSLKYTQNCRTSSCYRSHVSWNRIDHGCFRWANLDIFHVSSLTSFAATIAVIPSTVSRCGLNSTTSAATMSPCNFVQCSWHHEKRDHPVPGARLQVQKPDQGNPRQLRYKRLSHLPQVSAKEMGDTSYNRSFG